MKTADRYKKEISREKNEIFHEKSARLKIHMEGVTLKTGYQTGVIGRVTHMHATYYHANWNFGPFFEAKVASEMAAFIQRYRENRDFLGTVVRQGQIEGAIAIDGLHAEEKGAHLRWFIVSDVLRSTGAGTLLVQNAMEFCRKNRYKMVYLWTFEGLDAARHIYEKAGFRLQKEKIGEQWGTKVKEQCFEMMLG